MDSSQEPRNMAVLEKTVNGDWQGSMKSADQ